MAAAVREFKVRFDSCIFLGIIEDKDEIIFRGENPERQVIGTFSSETASILWNSDSYTSFNAFMKAHQETVLPELWRKRQEKMKTFEQVEVQQGSPKKKKRKGKSNCLGSVEKHIFVKKCNTFDLLEHGHLKRLIQEKAVEVLLKGKKQTSSSSR
jgi:hypothetical protein